MHEPPSRATGCGASFALVRPSTDRRHAAGARKPRGGRRLLPGPRVPDLRRPRRRPRRRQPGVLWDLGACHPSWQTGDARRPKQTRRWPTAAPRWSSTAAASRGSTAAPRSPACAAPPPRCAAPGARSSAEAPARSGKRSTAARRASATAARRWPVCRRRSRAAASATPTRRAPTSTARARTLTAAATSGPLTPRQATPRHPPRLPAAPAPCDRRVALLLTLDLGPQSRVYMKVHQMECEYAIRAPMEVSRTQGSRAAGWAGRTGVLHVGVQRRRGLPQRHRPDADRRAPWPVRRPAGRKIVHA
jgi:hypothetical protein